MRGYLEGGIWWSWHFQLQLINLERRLGKKADDILAEIMGCVIAERPDNHGADDYTVCLKLPGIYDEERNWIPPDTLAIVVRLRYVEDLKRHEWSAQTIMFTRELQTRKNRGLAQTAESHFRTRVVRRQYGRCA